MQEQGEQQSPVGRCCIDYYPMYFPCASISCAPDTTVTEPDPTLPQISSPASPRIVNTLSESPSMVNIIFISLTIVVHRNQLLSIKHVSLPTADTQRSVFHGAENVHLHPTCISRQCLRLIM